jgi:uncharacterized protein YndB with AHSA1/START domain
MNDTTLTDVTAAPKASHATKLRTPRAVADHDAGIVLATADVALSPERAFRAYATDEVERWWGSDDTYWMTEWASEVRMGGAWSVVIRFADGNRLSARGIFLDVDAPHKLVHTRAYEFDHPLLGRRDTTVTVFFEPVGTGTRVTVRHEGFEGAGSAADEHAAGWERVLAWLQAYGE